MRRGEYCCCETGNSCKQPFCWLQGDHYDEKAKRLLSNKIIMI